MDSVIIIGALAATAGLIAVGLLGYKQQKKAAAATEKIDREILNRNPGTDLMGQISYHGGFPQMAKPSVLQLGLTKDGLIIYDYKGWSGKVYCRDWHGVERFTVLAKANTAGKSTVVLGPLVPLFFQDKLRHFIAIQYTDINGQENHLLFELDNETMQKKIFEKLCSEKNAVDASLERPHCFVS